MTKESNNDTVSTTEEAVNMPEINDSESVSTEREADIEKLAEKIVDGLIAKATIPPVTEEERNKTMAYISGASAQLLSDGHIFLAHLNINLMRVITRTTPTAAVGAKPGKADKVTLWVNPDFFAACKGGVNHPRLANQRAGVIMHELLHILFRHVHGFRHVGRDQDVWNWALDMVVNQHIPYDLPFNPVRHDMPSVAHLNLLPNKTADYYYDALMSDPKNTAKSGGNGNGGNGGNDGDDHSFMRGLSENDQIMLDAKVKEIIHRLQREAKDKAKLWGSLPGPLAQEIQAWIKITPPKVNWRVVLRSFAASCRSSQIKSTVMRASKRFGTIPGTRMRRKQQLLVIVDTSGSMSDEEIGLCFSEIHGMLKRGAEITVLECDSQPQRNYPYKGITPKGVAGRGGTVFDPAIQWANEAKKDWNGIIFLTDGYAAPLTVRPKAPLLWVVTPNGGSDPNVLTFARHIIQLN